MKKEAILEKLWKDYSQKNPQTKEIHNLFISEGEQVVNDHIAFRTFEDPRINIDVLSRLFISAGYEEKQSYRFDSKHLMAKHYEHSSDELAPRIFISQLVTSEMSIGMQEEIKTICDSIPENILASEDLIFSGRQWGLPSYLIYEKLREESEYAAWLYVNGFTVNHFTVNVNALKKHDSLQKVNAFLKSKGYQINDAGGEIHGTPEELLEQSSVKAEILKTTFSEGEYDVTGCYYEFAKRYPDSNGKLYSGFIAKSADKIFQSTDLYKK